MELIVSVDKLMVIFLYANRGNYCLITTGFAPITAELLDATNVSQFIAEITDYIESQKNQLLYDNRVKQIYHILCHAPTPSLLVKLVAFIIFKTGVILLYNQV